MDPLGQKEGYHSLPDSVGSHHVDIDMIGDDFEYKWDEDQVNERATLLKWQSFPYFAQGHLNLVIAL